MTPAAMLTERIGGRWHGSYGTARCPAHDDHSPSLTIRDGDRAPLLRCHRDCDAADIIAELRRRGLWPLYNDKPERTATAQDRQRREAETRDYLLSLWRAARPIGGTPAETYLRERDIREFPPSLRFHPGLKHTETGLLLPALVAAVQAPDRSIIGLHRTFLRADGLAKAPVSNPRKMLGRFVGGAVRLAAADVEMAVGEGIETAISYMQAGGIPSWAAICTAGMRAVVLPPLPLAATVHLLVDLDEPGEAAAHDAAGRLAREGRRVKLARPTAGKDFNDALREARHAQ